MKMVRNEKFNRIRGTFDGIFKIFVEKLCEFFEQFFMKFSIEKMYYKYFKSEIYWEFQKNFE